VVCATGWSWEYAERLPIDAYNALAEYWREECPPADVIIKAIAQTLGCRFGSDRHTSEMDAESLFRTISVNPATAPVWNPKPLQVTLGKN
jgi:hypothetical protein